MAVEKRSSDHDHLLWIEQKVPAAFAGKRVLDVGCGSGYLCEYALNKGAKKSVGIDIISPTGVDASSDWHFLQVNLEQLGWEQSLKDQAECDEFDLVLALDILEHVSSPWNLLGSLWALMTPGSLLVLTTPNVNSWERLVKPNHWSGVIDPQHKTLFNKYSLDYILRKVGFEVQTLEAPIRKLSAFNKVMPSIGGQLVCIANRPPS
ncbi:MAG: class I SAM-dependent methyltransferase [Oligoflexales bacterium]|nr:class I SAM-dependent methyltransferase [Oligoflexales bacterium]